MWISFCIVNLLAREERDSENNVFVYCSNHVLVFFHVQQMYICVFRMRLRRNNDDTKYVNMIMERWKRFAIRIAFAQLFQAYTNVASVAFHKTSNTMWYGLFEGEKKGTLWPSSNQHSAHEMPHSFDNEINFLHTQTHTYAAWKTKAPARNRHYTLSHPHF